MASWTVNDHAEHFGSGFEMLITVVTGELDVIHGLALLCRTLICAGLARLLIRCQANGVGLIGTIPVLHQ